MRQRIDTGDRQREVRVVLVGERKALRFDPKLEANRVAIEGALCGCNPDLPELVSCQQQLVVSACAKALAPDSEPVANLLGQHNANRFGQDDTLDDSPGLKSQAREPITHAGHLGTPLRYSLDIRPADAVHRPLSQLPASAAIDTRRVAPRGYRRPPGHGRVLGNAGGSRQGIKAVTTAIAGHGSPQPTCLRR